MPDLKAALAELDMQIGLQAPAPKRTRTRTPLTMRAKTTSLGRAPCPMPPLREQTVKEQAHLLVQLAAINHSRELNCEPPHLVPLNRLFLGNPGTGKTTVAKIYGRILKGLSYLSDGSVEVRTPSDLIANAVGGTEEKTAALLEICKGKVLVIDEAYGLHEGMYGARAIDTIVSKVQPDLPTSPLISRNHPDLRRSRPPILRGAQRAGRGHRGAAPRLRGADAQDAPRGQPGPAAPLLA